jgi:cytochrome oxidase Cu insertion factor (SCO1/SenC/PrrC family)
VKTLSALAGLAFGIGLATAAQPSAGRQPPAAPAVDVEKLGPKVGEKVPDFTLDDQTGQPRALSSLLGPKGAVLLFFRSADW